MTILASFSSLIINKIYLPKHAFEEDKQSTVRCKLSVYLSVHLHGFQFQKATAWLTIGLLNAVSSAM